MRLTGKRFAKPSPGETCALCRPRPPNSKAEAWLREHKPPLLVVRGRNDPSFIAAGAEAFKRALPDAEIHLLDAGHFALDEKKDDIESLVLAFLAEHSSTCGVATLARL
jgi:pimeloyl-ACP methyl ester carboxylesterase